VKVTLLNFTPDTDKTVTLAAKLCYPEHAERYSEDRVSGISHKKFLLKIPDMGQRSFPGTVSTLSPLL
jgi:hypothetical protein